MTSQPPPLPLNYLPPNHEPPQGAAKPLLIGLGIGSFVSLVAWVGGWQNPRFVESNGFGFLIALIPGAKLVAGVTCLCLRGKRAFGGGLLLSIAIGFMIFFGACAANIKF